MDTIGFIATVLGTSAGIASLWFATSGWKKRLIGFFGLFCIAASAFYISGVNSELANIKSISRQANALLKDHRINYTNEAFILAGLAFIEANQTQFPDTYKLAQQLCKNYNCTSPNVELQDGYNSIEGASMMAGILKGIAAMHSE